MNRTLTEGSVEKILKQELPLLLQKILVEIGTLPDEGDHHQTGRAKKQQQLLKQLNDKHKTLKIILQNIALILELNPTPSNRDKAEISQLLETAEKLMDKKIINHT